MSSSEATRTRRPSTSSSVAFVLEVLHPLDGELSEGHTAPAPLLGVGLEPGLLGVVLADQFEHARRGLGFGQGASDGPPAASAPTAGTIGLDPRAPQCADHWAAAAVPLAGQPSGNHHLGQPCRATISLGNAAKY